MMLEVTAVLVALGLLLGMLPLPSGWNVFVAGLIAMLPLTPFLPANELISGSIRLSVPIWLLMAVVRQRCGFSGRIILGTTRADYIKISVQFLVIFVGYALMFTFSFLAHPMEPSHLAERLVGIVIGLLTAFLVFGLKASIAKPFAYSLTIPLLLSVLVGFLTPDQALVQGRLAGVFENANSTGFVGATLIAVVALRDKITVLGWAQVILGYVAISWSASRTAAVVATMILLVLLIRRIRWEFRILVFLVGSVAVSVVMYGAAAEIMDHPLFRSTASRTEWGWALDVFRAEPILGAGDILTPSGKELATGLGSSVLTLGVFGGSVGLSLFVTVALILLINGLQSGYRTVVVTSGFIAHSLLESWLAAPGSPFMLLVFFLLAAAMQCDAAERSGSRQVNESARSISEPHHNQRICFPSRV